jgi:hypothetical protein
MLVVRSWLRIALSSAPGVIGSYDADEKIWKLRFFGSHSLKGVIGLFGIMREDQRLNDFVDSVYDRVMEPQAWASNLERLASLVESDRALLAVKAGCSGKRIVIATSGINIQTKLPAYDGGRRSYFHDELGRLPPGVVSTPRTLMPHVKYSEDWWWQERAAAQGFSDTLGGHLVRTPSSYAWLTIECPARSLSE